MVFKNKSLTYILPMLGRNREEFWTKSGSINGFWGCFIGDTDRNIHDKIITVYTIDTQKNYVDRYNIEDYIVYIYDIPEQYIHSYNMFKESRYSQFDKEYKDHILSFYHLPIDSRVGGVLYRSLSMRRELERRLAVELPKDAELSSIINPEEEYLSKELLVKYEQNKVTQ